MDTDRRWLNRVLSVLFPRRCALCGTPVAWNEPFCPDCLSALPLIKGPVCPTCGRGLPYCHCAGRPFAYRRVAAPLYYEGAARDGIWRVKFRGQKSAAAGLAEIAAQTVQREYAGVRFDLSMPIPMSRHEQKARGFNQSALFCRAIARRLGLAFREDLLLKPLDTKPQRSCNAEQRWNNISGVFHARRGPALSGKTILLVDDVTTTGATFNECARELLAAGAAAVYCVAIAAVRLHGREESAG